MSWKDAVSFISPQGVEHTVEGKELTFYPISVRAAFSIRSVAHKIVKALTTLLSKNDTDQTCHSKVEHRNDSSVYQDIKTEAVSKEMVEFRTQQRDAALTEAVQALFDPDNSLIIGMLLVDSLRDVFDVKPSKDEIKKWVDEMPVPTLYQMLVGLAKGNREVFGPLADRAGEIMKASLSAAGLPQGGEAEQTTGEPSKTQ